MTTNPVSKRTTCRKTLTGCMTRTPELQPGATRRPGAHVRRGRSPFRLRRSGLPPACGLGLLSLLLLVLPAAVQAQYEYMLLDGTITITKYTGSDTTAIVPSTTNGLPVTGIGSQAFYNCDTLTSVTIPNSVSYIGSSAFQGCTGLTSVTLPNNLTRLADFVFASCTSLTGVTLPDSVTSIADYAFWDCSRLTNVALPNNVTSIGSSAFQSCGGLTGVTLGNKVASIGSSAFWNCGSLSSVALPNSVVSIGDYAFTKCSGLTALTVEALPSCYASVDGVLFNQNQTTLVVYPMGKAGSYTVPNGVTNIGSGAFCYCTNLTGVTLPDSVTSIGYVAFAGCTSLASVTFGTNVVSIGSAAFYNCTSLVNAALPGSVTSIGWGAFRNCSRLTSVTPGKGVTGLREWTFGGCSNLTSVTLGSGVASIGDHAFTECSRLSGVYFQGSPPALGLAAFYGDASTTIYYLAGTAGWGPTYGGRPTTVWGPQVLAGDASFGVRTNRFGFTITGPSGLVVAVETCTDPANPLWTPLETNTLADGACYFSDPQWTNQPARYYRLRTP